LEGVALLMELSKAQRKYLVAVLRTMKMGWTRLKRVSEYMKVKMPSAKQILDGLTEAGLLYYEKRGGITLTEEGKSIVNQDNEKLATVEKFLSQVFLLDESTSRQGAWNMYFDMPDIVSERFVIFAEFIDKCPMTKPLFIRDFGEYLKTGKMLKSCLGQHEIQEEK
jgi:DtxR family Mn-dependent transcriptional regulator